MRTFNRYQVDETSNAWKQWCLPYPCTPQVKFPGYATKVIPQGSLGPNVIVQLWKGRCERLMGGTVANHAFPGGVGAEVGIYRKRAAAAHEWYPAPDLNTKIEWALLNPVDESVFLASGPETTYWCNAWMTASSYHSYVRFCNTHTNEPNGRGVPSSYVDYTLIYTINGHLQQPWGRTTYPLSAMLDIVRHPLNYVVA